MLSRLNLLTLLGNVMTLQCRVIQRSNNIQKIRFIFNQQMRLRTVWTSVGITSSGNNSVDSLLLFRSVLLIVMTWLQQKQSW